MDGWVGGWLDGLPVGDWCVSGWVHSQRACFAACRCADKMYFLNGSLYKHTGGDTDGQSLLGNT